MSNSYEEVMQVPVREKWPDEASKFTPWLSQNLDLLGEEIGIKLELVQTEKQIGSLYLDILARESDTDVMVAIENQLEWTDIDHLGRLLIYATGSDARVVIWVAPDFIYEHALTLHRLNEWTNKEIRFYCVKIEVIKKTDSSCFNPRFRKVVYPGGWNRNITLPPEPPLSPDMQKFHDFFQPLVTEMIRTKFADKAIQNFDHTDRFFPSRINQRVGYSASLEKGNSAWVTFHIRMEDREQTKQLFDALDADRQQIESSIVAAPHPEWHWYRHDNYNFSSINIRKDGSIYDPKDKLEETRAWMLDLLPKLKEVFETRLEKLLK